MNLQFALRTVGFLLSLILTLASYFLIIYPDVFHLEINKAILFIFIFAIAQSIVQLVCFINLWREKGTLWNLLVFASTFFIILIIILFSIWVMHHLDRNMMPHLNQ